MRDRRGFTLIELLVSMAIFAVLATALGASLSAGITAWKRGRRAADQQQEARAVLERLARDLRNAIPAPGITIQGDDKSISFYTTRDTVGDAAGPLRRLVQVSYQDAPGPGDQIGAVNYGESPPRQADKSATRALTTLPAQIRFRYAYAPGNPGDPVVWQTLWTDKIDLPASVRINLILRDAAGEQEDFEKTVSLPMGVLKPWKG